MKVWKQFCRMIEGKKAVRHFGDLTPMIERCAVFEFTDEQIQNARMHVPADLSVDDEHYPIPPFPFPQMCMVGSGGVIVLQSPVMDEATGVLEFEMIMYGPDANDFFQRATCVVDSTTLNEDGQFPMKLQGIQGLWNGTYWDEDLPYSAVDDHGLEAEEMVKQLHQSRKRTEEHLAQAKKSGDPHRIQEAQDIYDRVLEDQTKSEELIAQVRRAHEDVALLEKKSTEMQFKEARDAFYLGLQEVNWINHPNHFTLEVQEDPGSRKKKKAKKGRIRRMGERPRHVILKRSEIENRWRKAHQGGTHAPPIPHLRRGHYRTLRSDRWGDKQGQRIWVRASHVGGECVEWRDGDVHYKVL